MLIKQSLLRFIPQFAIRMATSSSLFSIIDNLHGIIDILNKTIAEREATIRSLQDRIENDNRRIEMISSYQQIHQASFKNEIIQLLKEREDRILGAVEDIHELVESDSRLSKKRKVSFNLHCPCDDEETEDESH